ncbi:MAG: hypothetical protein ACM3X1_06570 [Ignavibacteriales bacterium]
MVNGTSREVPPDIKKMLKSWYIISSAPRAIHIFLVIVATVSSLYVAATVGSEKAATGGSENQGSVNQLFATPGITAGVALTAAISTALLTGFDVGSKSNRTRRAWRTLNAAVMRYQHWNIDLPKLIDVYEECEAVIGDVKEQPDR